MTIQDRKSVGSAVFNIFKLYTQRRKSFEVLDDASEAFERFDMVGKKLEVIVDSFLRQFGEIFLICDPVRSLFPN
jgi:hypothetical protein